MFEAWRESQHCRTLFRVERRVEVDAQVAFPEVAGSLNLNGVSLAVRAAGLRFEPTMPGRQIAWIRCCTGGFLGVVEMTAYSADKQSQVTMQLWLPPHAFQLAT